MTKEMEETNAITRQILFLKPTYHPKDTSRRQLQQIYEETCRTMLRDLFYIKKLTVAYNQQQNTRDKIIPSKLKSYNGEKNSVEHHIKNTSLENCLSDVDHYEDRKIEKANEDHLKDKEIEKINNIFDT